MIPVEACPVHHTVKQQAMTLNTLLTSAESAFGACVSELSRPRHWRQLRFKMNTNHFSFSVSVSALNLSWLYRKLDVPCCPVHSAQLWMRMWILTGVSSAIYMQFWRSYDNKMLYEVKWSVARLAFNFCSRVLFVLSRDNCRLAQWAWLNVWRVDALNANWCIFIIELIDDVDESLQL